MTRRTRADRPQAAEWPNAREPETEDRDSMILPTQSEHAKRFRRIGGIRRSHLSLIPSNAGCALTSVPSSQPSTDHPEPRREAPAPSRALWAMFPLRPLIILGVSCDRDTCRYPPALHPAPRRLVFPRCCAGTRAFAMSSSCRTPCSRRRERAWSPTSSPRSPRTTTAAQCATATPPSPTRSQPIPAGGNREPTVTSATPTSWRKAFSSWHAEVAENAWPARSAPNTILV